MNKLSLLTMILLVTTLKALSQNGALNLPNFSVHSPEVSNLGKYGEYAIDNSTGVPSIDIPLHTIKGTRLRADVSLSYHASGIKVDQESSFVGLGWILHCGGVITRIVRGKPDENSGFLTTGSTLPTYNSIDDLQGAGTISNSAYLKELYTKDLEPDLFTIAAQGLADEFCANNSGQFVSLNQEPLSYQVDLNTNLIIVKDRKGNTYRFGKSLDGTLAIETPYNVYNHLDTEGNGLPDFHAPTEMYTNAWFLTEIISADGAETISFKYRSGIITSNRITNASRYIFNDNITESKIDALGQVFDGYVYSDVSSSITTQQIPYQIIHSNGSIEFTSVSDRVDLLNAGGHQYERVRINGMIVYDSKGAVQSRVAFQNTDYFDRTAVGGAINPGSTIAAYQRKSLRLNGVQFFDKNNVFINQYAFDYDPTPLPPKYSTAQDFWGYYNGKGNVSFIPLTFYTTSPTGIVYAGENRNTDFNYMKAAILTKITYPTGGYTLYEYESNYYLNKFQQQNMVEDTRQFKAFAINRLATCDPDFMPNIPAHNIVQHTVTETLNSSAVLGSLYVYFSDFQNTNGGQSMTVTVTDLDGNGVYNFSHSPTDRTQFKTYNVPITIIQGHRYRIDANTNGVTGSNYSMCNSPFIEVGITYNYWRTTTSEQVVPTQAGGLRVMSVTNYNAENKAATKKSYEYGELVGGKWVGKLITDPNKNFYINKQLYARDPSNKELRKILWFTAQSQVELGMNNGCPVSYEKVTEKVVDPGSANTNGKTEYYYTPVAGDYEPKGSVKYPYEFINYPTWKKQRLSQTIDYSFVDNMYSQVRKTTYQYEPILENRIKTLKMIDFEPDWYMAYKSTNMGWIYTADNPQRFYYYNYYVSRGRFLFTGQTVTDYLANGKQIVSEKSYEYNAKFDLAKEKWKNSRQEDIETRYKYTADLDYSNLAAKNIISLPVQQEQWVNGKTRTGSILRYDDNGITTERYQWSSSQPTTPVPYTVAATIPSNYERKERLYYDPVKLTLREMKNEHSANGLFIWSYNHQFIIAEISNAKYEDVVAILGSTNMASFAQSNPTDAQVVQFLAPLRTDARLANAMIKTYTHNPSLGVTSMTDSRGVNIYYEYDDAGRLKAIRDHDNKVLKTFDYKYAQSIP
jgi:YD repeat-containing protein